MVWAFILFLSFSGCVYMITKIWTKYKSNPIVIGFETATSPIYKIPFPAVTLCPEAVYADYKFNYSDIFARLEDHDDVTADEQKIFDYIRVLCEENITTSCLKDTYSTFDEDFFDVLHKIQPDFFAHCSFFNIEIGPCEKLFVSVFTDVGICYSFNIYEKLFKEDVYLYNNFYKVDVAKIVFNVMNTNLSSDDFYPIPSLLSGIQNSLRIYLRFNESKMDEHDICSSAFRGYRLLLHNSMNVPMVAENYFRVDYDKMLMVAVTPKHVKISKEVAQMDVNKRECFLLHEKFLKYFHYYTVSNCNLECLTNATLKKCGCVSYYMPRTSTTSICTTIESLECVETAYNNISGEQVYNQLRQRSSSRSLCNCRPLCEDLSYKAQITYSDLHGLKNHEENTVGNYSWDRRSLVAIYFDDDQYLAMERKELFGFFDLVSNFGGVLGLFTGFSLMSLVEILYYFSLRIYCNTHLYKRWTGRVDRSIA